MMYSILLFMHFVGISIGAGTGIYMFALGRHASRNMEQAEARTLMPGINATIARVGDAGLILLLASGIGMGLLLGDSVVTTLFVLKMALVVVIIGFVLAMKYLAQRIRITGNPSTMKLARRLGMLGPVLGLTTILVAVMLFH